MCIFSMCGYICIRYNLPYEFVAVFVLIVIACVYI